MSQYITFDTVYRTRKGRIGRVVNSHPYHLEIEYVVHEWGVNELGFVNTRTFLIIGKFSSFQEAKEWLEYDIPTCLAEKEHLLAA
jgi:hypothetical protein